MNLQGIRTVIDRLGLPPRLAIAVKEIEQRYGPLEEQSEESIKEINAIKGLVDGDTVLHAIVGKFLDSIELPPEVAQQQAAEARASRSTYERWLEANQAEPELLTLLLVDGLYVAFDHHATQIANGIEEHIANVSGHQMIGLKQDKQPEWEAKLTDANLDVALVEEDDDSESGYAIVRLLAEGTANN